MNPETSPALARYLKRSPTTRAKSQYFDPNAERLTALVKATVRRIRALKQEWRLPPKESVPVVVELAAVSPEEWAQLVPLIEAAAHVTIVSALPLGPQATGEIRVSELVATLPKEWGLG